MSKYALFDSHCDTATELWRTRHSLRSYPGHVNLSGMERFSGCGQFFAFCTLGGGNTGWTCEQLLWEPYAYFRKQLDLFADSVLLCTSGCEYDQAVGAGKTAIFLSLEGAEGISCDPGRLEQLREAGITMVNLTWNADNALAGCSYYDGPGLTSQGKEFVRRAQRLGIIIDVSHISDRAFWDIMDITEKPVVASHSNSRRLCRHSRNLTDEQYLAICQTGGYAGINLYSSFLAEDRIADLETVYRHMDHFLQLGGEHVALGGDLDGCEQLPLGFSGIRDYEKLALFLEQKCFRNETIQNIYCNTMKKVVTLCTM